MWPVRMAHMTHQAALRDSSCSWVASQTLRRQASGAGKGARGDLLQASFGGGISRPERSSGLAIKKELFLVQGQQPSLNRVQYQLLEESMDIRENYKRDATEAASLCRPKPKRRPGIS